MKQKNESRCSNTVESVVVVSEVVVAVVVVVAAAAVFQGNCQ